MPNAIDDAELRRLGPGVFVYIQGDGSWWINNAGLIVCDEFAISIDTCGTEARARAYASAIAATGATDLRYIVATHHHGDHTHGNSVFENATVIAHENTTAALARRGISGNDPLFTPFDVGLVDVVLPGITYATSMTLVVGEHRCEIRHPAVAAHTGDDSYVWLDNEGVLFAGDLLFNGVTPLMMGGSVQGSMSILLDDLATLDAQTVIPGHGVPGDGAIITSAAAYCDYVLATARSGMRSGKTPLESARQYGAGEFGGWLDPERLVANLHRAYADLAGVPPGDRIDTAAAAADMKALNRGRPITTTV
jgi:cyclase